MGPNHTYQHEYRTKRPTRRGSPVPDGIYLGQHSLFEEGKIRQATISATPPCARGKDLSLLPYPFHFVLAMDNPAGVVIVSD